MCSSQVSEPHPPTGLNTLGWRVLSAEALPGFQLSLEFQDGTRGKIDLTALIQAGDAGVFESLRDPAVFNAVRVSHGAPSWPGDIDLAPDALHAAIKTGSPFPPRPGT